MVGDTAGRAISLLRRADCAQGAAPACIARLGTAVDRRATAPRRRRHVRRSSWQQVATRPPLRRRVSGRSRAIRPRTAGVTARDVPATSRAPAACVTAALTACGKPVRRSSTVGNLVARCSRLLPRSFELSVVGRSSAWLRVRRWLLQPRLYSTAGQHLAGIEEFVWRAWWCIAHLRRSTTDTARELPDIHRDTMRHRPLIRIEGSRAPTPPGASRRSPNRYSIARKLGANLGISHLRRAARHRSCVRR
jgi:hypothetical protein